MIDSIFQCINFSIFALLMVYVIRKFVVPLLREALVKQYRTMVTLHEEHEELATTQKNLEESIALQEDEAMVLFKKINRWRNEVETQKKVQSQEEALLLEKAHAKASTQLENYALRRTYTQVAPLVVERLNEELTQKFNADTEGHRYITTLLEKL